MAAVKTSPPHSSASPASSPEATAPEQMTQPVQKRKGGRKPVYATQEERKMRNRAAQAAFRERRTEYIKHLEATIKHHEEQLTGLQQSSRQAADEVLMLRYKNSLLERILLEKGIDVAAELRTYTGAQYDDRPTPVSQPAMPQSLGTLLTAHAIQQPPQQPPGLQGQLHRPGINRQQSQQKRALMNAGQDAVFIKTSPDSMRPARNQSPTVAGAIPTPPDHSAFQLPPHSATSTTRPEFQTPGLPVAQTYYPSPYQTHMEELGKLPRSRNTMPNFSKTLTTILKALSISNPHPMAVAMGT
ncbi:hypothetical protein EDC01DRAFT_760709 [Geopyxis carbonaria]|nr:hypothetical protein EDC01DRAFT_760709 [Geopyxis carbonaria]